MPIQFSLDKLLAEILTGRQSIVEVKGETVRQCLEDLVRRFPAFADFYRDRELCVAVGVALNNPDNPLEDLDTPVKEGDQVFLYFQGIMGG